MFIFVILSIITASLIILAYIHSYLRYGFRLTFNFFLFSFLYVSKWVIKNSANIPAMFKTAQQIKILELSMCGKSIFYKSIANYLYTISTILGWIFLLYVSWYLAGRIMQRLSSIKDRLFPTLLLSGLIVSCIVYIVEAMAGVLGWWNWTVFCSQIDKFLIGCPFHPIRKGFYFSIYFLAAYFLIECTKFRRANWKAMFFIIPFIHIFCISIFGPSELVRLIEHIVSLVVLVILVLFSPLDFDFSFDNTKSRKFQMIDNTMLLMILVILLILAVVNITVFKQAFLNLAILPFVFFLFFSIKFIPVYIILACALILIPLLKNTYSLFVPLVVILILRYLMPRINKKKIKYCPIEDNDT